MIYKYLQKLEYDVILQNLSGLCSTYGGRELALSLVPYTSRDKVHSELNETIEVTDLIHCVGELPINEIPNQSLNLKKLNSAISLNAKSLLEIGNVLKISRQLKSLYKEAELADQHISNYFEELYSNIQIEKSIFSCIISENEIADNASPTLSSIRRNKKNLEVSIRNKLSDMLHSSTYSKYIMESVVTIRNDRFVIPVKDEYRSKIKGFLHDTSSSGSTVYIEPMSVFEMNNSINNLVSEEHKEIERILQNLSNKLFAYTSELERTIYIINKLDFISAKAKLIISDNYVCPKIENFVDLKNARHPLIDKHKVVPINIFIGKNDFSTLVITGPNTGGKTVTLKTVGLLCAMAQSGIPIPVAEGSCIKIFDNIFADIGDEQSIEESLSTFSAHMKNVVNILDNHTKDSLILLDELGSGTDPIEGANLAISLLEQFNSSGALTIATTHYHEIKNYCLSHDGFQNASVEFDVKTLKPTYKLLIGIPGKSNAFEICKQIGIPESIINRASSLISKPDADLETVMKEIYDNKAQVEKEKDEISKNLIQVETLRKSLEKQYSNKLAHEQEKVEKAKKEAREILLDAKHEANRIIKELNNMDKGDLKNANKLRDELNSSTKKIKSDGIDLSVLLQLNNKEASKISSHSSKVHIQNTKVKNISPEINLLGETVDSAVMELEQYFDNCRMANLKQVRVVHGKGTGKLREGIHKYLKTSKYVESFRIGEYGEGDYGVTIVVLK